MKRYKSRIIEEDYQCFVDSVYDEIDYLREHDCIIIAVLQDKDTYKADIIYERE